MHVHDTLREMQTHRDAGTHTEKAQKRRNVHRAKCTRFQQNEKFNKTSKQQVTL